MRIFALISCLLLASCGFKPLYEAGGSSTEMQAFLAAVDVAPIPDRIGQVMQNRLVSRLASNGRSEYRLEVALEQSSENFGVRPDTATTQEQLTMVATMRLIPVGAEKPVLTESLRARTSFDLVLSDFATVTQREDSARRLALELAERIHRRLALYFSKKADQSAQATNS